MASFHPSLPVSRRNAISALAAGATLASGLLSTPSQLMAIDDPITPGSKKRRVRFGVSTYSFWQFNRKELRDIGTCIDLAAEWGFDGVEILHRQMTDESNATLQKIKQRAFVNGLDLCGFSIHQGWVSPDPEVRRKNTEHTIHCIELSYALGIPTMRVNTGRWGTSGSFDDLMKNRGIEPVLAGHTEDEGYKWVIDGLTECLPAAERCGVTMGLENTAGGHEDCSRGQLPLVEDDAGHGQLFGGSLRSAGADGGRRSARAGQDLLWWRVVVYVGSRLPTHCQATLQAQLWRLRIVGI
jgi:L-ribulose-5-phosphate 3-epimerase